MKLVKIISEIRNLGRVINVYDIGNGDLRFDLGGGAGVEAMHVKTRQHYSFMFDVWLSSESGRLLKFLKILDTQKIPYETENLTHNTVWVKVPEKYVLVKR